MMRFHRVAAHCPCGQRLLLGLAGFAVMSLPACGPTGRELEARADMESFDSAVRAYRSEYGKPLMPERREGIGLAESVLAVLSARESVDSVANLNPLKIRFLQISSDRMIGGRWIDPWGHPYQIAFADVDNEQRLIAWSIGRNEVNENGGGDDLASWKASKKTARRAP